MSILSSVHCDGDVKKFLKNFISKKVINSNLDIIVLFASSSNFVLYFDKAVPRLTASKARTS